MGAEQHTGNASKPMKLRPYFPFPVGQTLTPKVAATVEPKSAGVSTV
jgi:hypothetical protein